MVSLGNIIGFFKNKDIAKCNNCSSKETIKVELNCRHLICRNCTVSYLMEKFSMHEAYDYNVFCKSCNSIVKISIFHITFKGDIYLDCKDRCKWVDIETRIDYTFESSDG